MEREAIRWSVGWILAVLAVLSVARLLSPTAGTELRIPGWGAALPELCSFRGLLGSDCPGCGLTRSFVLAVRFRFTEAWAMHPIGTLLVLYLACSIPQRLWRLRQLLAGTATRSTLPWELGLLVGLTVAAYIRWAAVVMGLY